MISMKQWDGFKKGNWTDEIDVREFIQLNYKPMKEMKVFRRSN